MHWNYLLETSFYKWQYQYLLIQIVFYNLFIYFLIRISYFPLKDGYIPYRWPNIAWPLQVFSRRRLFPAASVHLPNMGWAQYGRIAALFVAGNIFVVAMLVQGELPGNYLAGFCCLFLLAYRAPACFRWANDFITRANRADLLQQQLLQQASNQAQLDSAHQRALAIRDQEIANLRQQHAQQMRAWEQRFAEHQRQTMDKIALLEASHQASQRTHLQHANALQARLLQIEQSSQRQQHAVHEQLKAHRYKTAQRLRSMRQQWRDMLQAYDFQSNSTALYRDSLNELQTEAQHMRKLLQLGADALPACLLPALGMLADYAKAEREVLAQAFYDLVCPDRGPKPRLRVAG
ncbi:hypothetical protein V8J88_12080 [Massilia sp. W12]|uniref:hypothetical protein n=1 Tax=Massilia sp. W12 TaxID=3126507 RepID=UPI0030CD3072